MLKYRRNKNKELSGVEVLSKAQQIAFAPFTFQCVGALIDLGILEFIDKKPADIDEIIQNCNVTEYCVKVLFDAAILSGFITEKNGKYSTTKISRAFLYDDMSFSIVDNDIIMLKKGRWGALSIKDGKAIIPFVYEK